MINSGSSVWLMVLIMEPLLARSSIPLEESSLIEATILIEGVLLHDYHSGGAKEWIFNVRPWSPSGVLQLQGSSATPFPNLDLHRLSLLSINVAKFIMELVAKLSMP